MIRGTRHPAFAVLVCSCVVALCSYALAAHPSLCLSNPTGCDEPGTTVNVEVVLGPGDSVVVGAQFLLSFDPDALTPLEVLPGQACDAQSPINLEIYKNIDNDNGSIFYATGINPFEGGQGTYGPTTIACIRFLPRSINTTQICLLEGEEPQFTRLSDESGHLTPIDNSTACPTDQSGALACKDVIFKPECRCNVGADCDNFNSDCRVGVCDLSTLLCTVTPINEGGVCDDDNDCTVTDVCQAGECVGSGCTNQSLCLDEVGTPPGSLMAVPVRLGAGDPFITGAQFTMQWDPAALDLVAVLPGSTSDASSPFSLEIQRLTGSAGELFYAVGVAPGSFGTQGPSTLAWAYFNILDRTLADVCLFEATYPLVTRLVDIRARYVTSYNEGSCSADQGAPFLDCQRLVMAEIPAASEWGLVVLALVLLVGAKIRFARI